MKAYVKTSSLFYFEGLFQLHDWKTETFYYTRLYFSHFVTFVKLWELKTRNILQNVHNLSHNPISVHWNKLKAKTMIQQRDLKLSHRSSVHAVQGF